MKDSSSELEKSLYKIISVTDTKKVLELVAKDRQELLKRIESHTEWYALDYKFGPENLIKSKSGELPKKVAEKRIKNLIAQEVNKAVIKELEKLITPSAMHRYLLKCSGNDIADRIKQLTNREDGHGG